MNKIFVIFALLCPLIVKADCPDVFYTCFANKEPDLFTQEEMNFYNERVDGALEEQAYDFFPFVSVGTYYDPLKIRCVKEDDASTRATNYCKSKYPHKEINVKELEKTHDASVYVCLSNGSETKLEVLAYDQDIAQLKCKIIAASLAQDPTNWQAKKQDLGTLKKIQQKIAPGAVAQTFINEWEMAKNSPSMQDFIPHWLKTAVTRTSAAVSDSTLTALARAIKIYQEKKTQQPTIAELGDLLSKPNIFSLQTAREDLKKACKKLKFLYHPDKHLGSDQTWWTKELTIINNACSTLE